MRASLPHGSMVAEGLLGVQMVPWLMVHLRDSMPSRGKRAEPFNEGGNGGGGVRRDGAHGTGVGRKMRARFGLNERNRAAASRLIKEAVEARKIVAVDYAAAKKLMKYVLRWAAGMQTDSAEGART